MAAGVEQATLPMAADWGNRLLLTFSEEVELETAFRSHRASSSARHGELLARFAMVVSCLLGLAGGLSGGLVAIFQQVNAVAGFLVFGILALVLGRSPGTERTGAGPVGAVLFLALLHIAGLSMLTQDRIAVALNLESHLGSTFWTEANSAMVVVGLLTSSVLCSGLSLGGSLLLVHVVTACYAYTSLKLGSLEHGQLAALRGSFSYEASCLSRCVCLYLFGLLAFAVRRCYERDERASFVAGRAAVAPLLAPEEEFFRQHSGSTGSASAAVGGGESRAVGASSKAAPEDVPKRTVTVPHPPINRSAWRKKPQSNEALTLPMSQSPSKVLHAAMHDKTADWARIRHIAANIQRHDYTLRMFFEDCTASFPELTLFLPEEGQQPCKTASSGVSNEAEYQRTIGALFAVYWLLRLHIDGRVGFCYGVDEEWKPVKLKRTNTRHNSRGLHLVGSQEGASQDVTSDDTLTSKSTDKLEQDITFQMMTEVQKRTSFFETMQWSMFEDLIGQAGCQANASEAEERIMALLCLTACHDIMKVESLLPVVQPEHAPYLGYGAGVVIRDHDTALAYVMQHFPELLPSFAGLPAEARRSVLFTQGKMNFNHGWFVQAESPPGGMLSTLKSVLVEGATASDLGLYFLHWFTDLSGAEATPLGGAEKFVLKFPHSVLASFLWSIPFLGRLESTSETAVVEQYLKARWRVLAPKITCPQDAAAIACMRIAVMAQSDEGVVDAFRSLPSSDRQCLSVELARTGCQGQRYSTNPNIGAGPAFLVYYGPALLQKNVDSPRCIRVALRVLAEVMRTARMLWPLSKEHEGAVVTITVAELKTQSIDVVLGVDKGPDQGKWVLVRHNDREGAVEFKAQDGVILAPREDGSTPLMEVLHFDRCFHGPSESVSAGDEATECDKKSSTCDDDDDEVTEPIVEKRVSRRASQLPFAAPDEEFAESTVESGLAASLRQENWVLKDKIASLSDEVARLRSRLSVSDDAGPVSRQTTGYDREGSHVETS